MISDGRYAFLVGYQTIWAFEPCAERGEPNPADVPLCAIAADLHLLDVKRGLSREEPKSSSARSAGG